MKFSTNLGFPLMAAALLTAGAMNAQVTATSVSSFTQGMRADGVSPVSAVRSNPLNAIGNRTANHDKNIGENSGLVEFVSLGFGGEIVLEFETPICNGDGMDLAVWETSYNRPSNAAWPEMAHVEARQNDCQPWVSLGVITQDAELDLGVLLSAKYIRISDLTNPLLPVFSSVNQDGFDVDAVVGFEGCADAGVDAPFSPNQVVSYTNPGARKSGFMPLASPRRNTSKMLGAPQINDNTTPEANVNFFSVGFESEVILKFPYAIFDAPGADLSVYETTFGDNSNRKCSNYPEKAAFYGSADGVEWFELTAIPTFDLVGGAVNDYDNILCRDGQLDIGGGRAINFIKLVDVSDKPSTFFPGSADGYDLDGIVGRCYTSAPPKLSIAETSEEAEIGEGVFGIEVYPNPASDIVNLNVTAVNLMGTYTVRVVDMMGRVVSSEVVNSANGSFIHTVSVSSLPAGIYAITVETDGVTEITKIVKN